MVPVYPWHRLVPGCIPEIKAGHGQSSGTSAPPNNPRHFHMTWAGSPCPLTHAVPPISSFSSDQVALLGLTPTDLLWRWHPLQDSEWLGRTQKGGVASLGSDHAWPSWCIYEKVGCRKREWTAVHKWRKEIPDGSACPLIARGYLVTGHDIDYPFGIAAWSQLEVCG